jgi:ATP-dependent RNA helicase DDX52/ROK1
MTQKEREDSISRMRRGETWVMVTTEVMARGIDFKGIREVINYDFPTTIQSYIHRIGRTGRAGREGKAVTMFTDDDAPYLKMYVFIMSLGSSNKQLLFRIANVILQSGSTVPDWILKLPKPSKMKRKQMGKVNRPDKVNPARNCFRHDALKKRCFFSLIFIGIKLTKFLLLISDIILGSKRRASKVAQLQEHLNSE